MKSMVALLIMLLFLLSAQWVAACTTRNANNQISLPVLVLPKTKASSQEQDIFYHDLLTLILERTEKTFGPCKIVQMEDELTRMRSAVRISSDQGIDLYWASTTIDREAMLRPVRIPLLKGLMGYKIFLINKDSQKAFAKVTNLPQLRQFRAGQGADWPDVEILSNSDIPVSVSANYESLFKMLSAKRFDFFPRGANQILSELRHNQDKDLMIEPRLALTFPSPVYFFVSKENEALAKRIVQGLQEMIADGSYDEFFYRHPLIKETITNLHLQARKIIAVPNPLLPPDTEKEPIEDWATQLKKYNPGIDI